MLLEVPLAEKALLCNQQGRQGGVCWGVNLQRISCSTLTSAVKVSLCSQKHS